jgi:hypothetical protein
MEFNQTMHIRLRVLLATSLLALGLAACGSATRQAPTPTIDTATEAPTPTTVSSSSQVAEPTAAPTAATVPTKEIYALGDTAQLDPFQITATRAEAAPQPESGEPRDGHQFVPLNITLHNTAGEPQEVALLLQLVLEDAAGKGYALEPGPSMNAVMSLNGRIGAGEQARGIVVFQVPDGKQGLRLIFRTIEAGATKEVGRVVFDIAD